MSHPVEEVVVSQFSQGRVVCPVPLVMALLLSGCISSHYALADNPTLAQSLARVSAAQAEAAAVHADSGVLITYDANETRERFSAHDPIPPPYVGTPRWLGTQGFNLSWDLDFWGRQAALVRQAKTRAEAAAFDSAGARLAIAGAVVRSYLELDRAYALADIAQRAEVRRIHYPGQRNGPPGSCLHGPHERSQDSKPHGRLEAVGNFARRRVYLRAITMDSVGPRGSTDMSRKPTLASHPRQSAGV